MRCRVEFETVPMEFPALEREQVDMENLKRAVSRYRAAKVPIAKNLAKAKKLLTPAQWAEWLRAEFGWTEEMAEHLMEEV